VFDSGLGGLTLVRELMQLLPAEQIIYFGDTGRVPYGSRSRETIVKYARQDIRLLSTFDLKAVLVACGTVSTTAMDEVAASYAGPVCGVVEPAAAAAAARTKNNRIGLIGTPATVRSGAFERKILIDNPKAKVFGAPCPLFVPLVENGRFLPDDRVTKMVAEEYLAPLKDAGVDTLLLGCTHYPLLAEIISSVMGKAVTLVDAGAEAARFAVRLLSGRDALAETGRTGSCRYLVSDRPDDFSRLASLFLRIIVEGDVKLVDIERY
jgi:glutamate racemase